MPRVSRLSRLLFSVRIVSLLLCCLPRVGAQVKTMTNGDSITFGVGASDPATMSYTAQLGRMLGSGFYVQKDGTGGATLIKSGDVSFWNTQGIRITSEMNPDFIYIMLGTNDSKPANWNKKDQYVPDYLSLVDLYRTLPANPRILLGLPPPATDSLNDVRGPVVANEVIPRILEVARQRNLRVVDAHSPFLDPFRSVLPDGIHPNDEGHGLIAKQIYQAIVNGRFWSALPSAWLRTDIGGAGFGGGDAVDDSGVFQILGAGLGIGGASDSFRLVSQSVGGDAELTARVLGQRNLDPLTASRSDAFAGVTIRENTAVDARHVSILATSGSGVSFRWRDAAGTVGGSVSVAGVVPPVWVRVRRSSGGFSGFYSADGVAWTQLGSTRNLTMAPTAQVGLAVSSALAGTLSHARLERVQLSGVVSSEAGTGSSGAAPAASETNTDVITISGGLDPASAGSRTIVNSAYAELFDPARAELRFSSEAASRPVLGLFAGGTREAAGFDGSRTMSGPLAQTLFTPAVSQDAGFVGAVRIPASGGGGKALLLCLNKNSVEPALGLGYDYGSGRFFVSFTQAFNGAPSEIYGPAAPRGATYVVRLQKTGGVVRLRVNGALAAETNSARPALLASGEGAPITLGGLRPLNPQFVGQLGKFHLRASALSDSDAAALETDIKTWLSGN